MTEIPFNGREQVNFSIYLKKIYILMNFNIGHGNLFE